MNQSLLIYLSILELWMFFDFLIWNYKDSPSAEILIRINSIFWFSTAFWFLNFAHSFLMKKRGAIFYGLAAGTGITILISLFTKLIIVGKREYFWGADIQHGPLFFVATMVIITIPALYVIGLFAREHFVSDETSRKTQLLLLIVGTISLLGFGVLSDVLLPILTEQRDHLRLASSVALGQVICIAIATLKYDFLTFDIDEVSFRYFQQSKDGVIGANSEGIILFSNVAAEEMLEESHLPSNSIADFIDDYKFDENYSMHWTNPTNALDKNICVTQSEVLHAGSKVGKIVIIRDVSDLAKTQENLRKLSSNLQSMIEEERTSIAREIHDELGQLLTGIKMDLRWFQSVLPNNHKTPAKKRFDSMAGLIDDAIRITRRISSALRPGILDDLGLVPAVEWYVDEFKKRSQLECSLDLIDEIEVSRDIATAVFRILQEALTNVLRHAEANKVSVSLSIDAANLLLKIEDDGIGFDNKHLESHKSIGILGMTERAMTVNGKFEITGKRDEGTQITLTIPMQQPKMDNFS